MMATERERACSVGRVHVTGWRAVIMVAGVVAAGCGGDDDHGDGAPDAAIDSCTVGIAVTAGELISPGHMTLEAIFSSGTVGQQSVDWDIWLDDDEQVSFTTPTGDRRTISIDLAQGAGVYRVAVAGTVGQVVCTGAQSRYNIRREGANTAAYRMRAVPRNASSLPAQEENITVYGGAHAFLENWRLERGSLMSGQVRGLSGNGAAAYIRLIGDGVLVRELFAAADGTFSVDIPAGSLPAGSVFDVWVIPTDNTLAPIVLRDMSMDALTVIDVDTGDEITGTVVDGTGAPIEGARVSGAVDDVPTTLGITGEDGSFAIRGHLGGALRLSVSPPMASGLPVVDLPTSAGVLATAAPIEIRYSDALSGRAATVSVFETDEVTPAAGARVTWTSAPIERAATATVGATHGDAVGRIRVSAMADENGAVPPVALVELAPEFASALSYDVVVEPGPASPGEGVGFTRVDIRPDEPGPATLSLAAHARIIGEIHDGGDPSGVAVANVEVAARPLGVLSPTTAASAHDKVAGGAFSLPVVGGGSYELTVTSTDPQFAPTRVLVDAPGPDQPLDIGSVAIPRAVKLSGRISMDGPAGGVHVMLLCASCTGLDAQRPVAEAVTDPTGAFVLSVPDPGVSNDS